MMMTLVIIMAGIFASGQSLTPRILEDGFRLMPTSFPFKVKTVTHETNASNPVAKSIKVNAEQDNYQVDFVLDFDPAIQSALIIGLYNEESDINNQTLGLPQLMNGSNVLTVPGGVYDILVAFDGYDHDRVVIREQVEISENSSHILVEQISRQYNSYQCGEPLQSIKHLFLGFLFPFK